MNVAQRIKPASQPTLAPESEIGSFRTFGPYGPLYEVIAVVKQVEDGD